MTTPGTSRSTDLFAAPPTPLTLGPANFHRVRLFAASVAVVAFVVFALAWNWREGWLVAALAVYEVGHAAYHIRKRRPLAATLLTDIIVVSLAIAIFRPPPVAIVTPLVYLVAAPILLTAGRTALQLVSTAVLCASATTFAVFAWPATLEWTFARSLLIVGAFVLIFGPLIIWMISKTTAQTADQDRIRAELEAARQRQEDILDSAPVGMAMTEVGPRRFVAVNRSFCDFLGYTESELLTMSIDDVVHPDDITASLPLAAAVVSAETDRFRQERRYVRKDGRVVWADFVLSVIRDSGGVARFTIGQIHDITRRKELEAERDLLLDLSLAIAGAVTSEDAMRSVLSKLCAAGGWTIGELWVPSGDRLERIHTWVAHPRDEAWLQETDASFAVGVGLAGAVFEGGKPIGIPTVREDPRFVNVEGSVAHGLEVALGVPVLVGHDVVAALVLFGGLGTDATADDSTTIGAVVGQLGQAIAVKLAEQERDRLAEILEHTTDFVGFSEPDGMVLYINPAGRSMVGIGTDEDITCLRVRDLHSPESARFLKEHVAPSLHRDGSWNGETELSTRDGRMIPVSQVVMSHLDEDGEVAYFSTVARDITIHKKLESHQEDVIRSKDEFIASVSHELRTPLTAVRGFAEILREPGYDLTAAERHEMIEAIASEATDVSDIVEDLLVAARSDIDQLSITSRAVDIAPLAIETVNRVRWTDRSVRIEVEPIVVIADPLRLRQVMRNLMVNAVRYGGPHVTVRTRRLGTMAVVEVADDGPGIPPDLREKIFAPYQRAHDHTGLPGSVGLGLSVSRRLARLMGGEVTYDHRDGSSLFQLHLPTADVPPVS
jgi:PAS domain S-box-containing protein